MTTNNRAGYHGDEDVIRRNIEGSREVIEARKRGAGPDELEDVNVQDLDTRAEEAPPGQSNTPIGGVSNSNTNGGTATRHKRG